MHCCNHIADLHNAVSRWCWGSVRSPVSYWLPCGQAIVSHPWRLLLTPLASVHGCRIPQECWPHFCLIGRWCWGAPTVLYKVYFHQLELNLTKGAISIWWISPLDQLGDFQFMHVAKLFRCLHSCSSQKFCNNSGSILYTWIKRYFANVECVVSWVW